MGILFPVNAVDTFYPNGRKMSRFIRDYVRFHGHFFRFSVSLFQNINAADGLSPTKTFQRIRRFPVQIEVHFPICQKITALPVNYTTLIVEKQYIMVFFRLFNLYKLLPVFVKLTSREVMDMNDKHRRAFVRIGLNILYYIKQKGLTQ